MLWPFLAGKVYLSTCGLMLIFSTPWLGVQAIHLDLVVEVADVADDGLVLHLSHVLEGDDVDVAGAGDVDVAAAEGVFDGGDFEAFHRRLQGVDRIDLGDDHARAHAAQRVRRALAHVAVAADDRHLAGDHHVGGALDAVGQRLAAAVEVVELRLGHRVVDVDRRNQQLALLPASCRGDGRRWWSLPRRRAIPWRPRASAAGLRRGPSSADP